MSERTLVAAFALVVAAAAPLEAQRAAELEAQLNRVTEESRVVDSTLMAAIRARRASMPTDTAAVEGITLVITEGVLSAAERAAVEEGLRRGVTSLVQRWGPRMRQLLGDRPWVLSSSSQRFANLRPMAMGSSWRGTRVDVLIPRPVTAERIEEFVLQHTGAHLPRLVPALTASVRTDVTLADEPVRLSNAARELAISWVTPARRCYAGSLADCRRVLSEPTDPTPRTTYWIDESDHQSAVIAASGDLPPDSVKQRRYRRCKDGDRAECTVLLGVMPARYPLSANLRATFVSYALRTGTPGTMDRLIALGATPAGPTATAGSRTVDPLGLLAAATGIPADSLVAGWRARTLEALGQERPSPLPVLASTALWSLLLLGISTRRPR